jgi:predicted O-methyltransferase YrrM
MRTYSKDNIDNTMFDFSGYYDKIAEMLPDNCRVAEIGNANGASAIYLLEAILNLGKTIEKFVMVDSLDYGGHEQAETIIHHLVRSGVGDHVTFLQMGSLDASCKFNDGYFDFVFVDASHEYSATKADIILWYRKMKSGAVLAGHDSNMPEVRGAINEIIPADMLEIIETEKDFGIWQVVKNDNKKLK